jgi:GNAT superfamily N-acetyltransferase
LSASAALVAEAVSGRAPLIRPATPADAPALAGLRYEFRTAIATPHEPRAAFLARCSGWMEQRIRETESGWRCWLATDGDDPAGNVWIYNLPKIPNPVAEPEAHAYITNLYVRQALRGHGVGGRLLGAALDWCRAQPIDSVILWPTPESRSLYSRHGFERGDDIMQLSLRG